MTELTIPSVLDDLSLLDVYRGKGKAPGERGPVPAGYPVTQRTLFAPVDDVHAAIVDLVKAATSSVVCSMFGFDDDEIADVLREKLESEHVFVQLSLDSSQAGGVHERAILARENYPASMVAIGRSEKSQILHTKAFILDGLVVIGGSTNLSASGEGLQANELKVVRDPLIAAEYRARLDREHAWIVQHATGTTVHRASAK